MTLLIILLIFVVLFGGGGYWYGGGTYRSTGFSLAGLLIVIILVLWLTGYARV